MEDTGWRHDDFNVRGIYTWNVRVLSTANGPRRSSPAALLLAVLCCTETANAIPALASDDARRTNAGRMCH